jgi:hypothetical protein
MTTQADFTDAEWELVLEGPTEAGKMVIAAERGGTFRESFSMSKAYAEARGAVGASELIDVVVTSKPKVDRTRHGSFEDLKEHVLQQLRDAIAVLESKAAPEEVDDYRRFVLKLARRVAEAHEEHGQRVSDAEEAAIVLIADALGALEGEA